ncbi:MAG TPA: site-specific integrase, partial [Hyphomonas sp.]|nr:site-specific integrase [Hyphomonas sp.]
MDTLPAFVTYLADERRMAAKTVEAYRSDLAEFFNFLRHHMGDEPTPKLLGELKARDIRAHIAQRRRDGLSDASVARLLSSIKALYRWLNRAYDIENAEVAYLQGPKRPQRLPRPVSV